MAVSPYSLARCSAVRPPLLMPALNISTIIIVIRNILVIEGSFKVPHSNKIIFCKYFSLFTLTLPVLVVDGGAGLHKHLFSGLAGRAF